ncbi:hypothetical protein CerSpe_112290 [Prunus speciosa]
MAAAATGAVKINADGVVHAASRLDGIGFMARNHAGSFLACKLVVLNGISNSVHAKLLAVREGLFFAANQLICPT